MKGSGMIGSLFLQVLLVFCLMGIPRQIVGLPVTTVVPDVMEFDWDLVIAHGKTLSFIAVDTNATIDIQIPMPTNSVQLWKSNPQEKTITLSTTPSKEQFAKDWEQQDLMSLIYEVDEPNLFFFTIASRDLTSIAVFNMSSNSTTLLFQCMNAIIDGFAYHNNILYWTETRAQIIMSVNNSDHKPWDSVVPVEYLKFNDRKVHSLAIDRDTGLVYWSIWEVYTSSIEYYDLNTHEQKTLINKGISKAQSLSIHNSYLYFTNKPFGTTFTIEKINLKKNSTIQEPIYEGRYQAPFSISPICANSLMWTDLIGRNVLIENTAASDSTSSNVLFYRHYKADVPNGFVIRNATRFNQRLCPVIGRALILTTTTTTTPSPSTTVTTQVSKEISVPGDALPVTSEDIFAPSTKRRVRLEADWCENSEDNHCLNGASCVLLEKKIYCICPPGYSGSSCEHAPLIQSEESSEEHYWKSALIAACSALLVLVILLSILSMYLGRKLRKTKRKPKIRRRVIVARGSESQAQSVCEMIDIENCCNMNICETPCYEITPSTHTNRKSGATSNSSGKESCKEDKQKLIEDV